MQASQRMPVINLDAMELGCNLVPLCVVAIFLKIQLQASVLVSLLFAEWDTCKWEINK